MQYVISWQNIFTRPYLHFLLKRFAHTIWRCDIDIVIIYYSFEIIQNQEVKLLSCNSS